MISFDSISKSFKSNDGQFQALDNITLTIDEHECFGVIGQSGAGKSTLLRMINALEQPTSGQVVVDGVTVGDLSGKALRQYKSTIGMIFQQFNLLNNKTVKENILLPLAIHDYEDTLDLDHVLDFVELSDKRDAYPAELSGGQKQRVGIARALITKPRILLCDETTSALDQGTTDDVVQVLKRVNEEFNMTIVVVTHELDVIKHLCDRSAILEGGKLLETLSVNKSDQTNLDQSYYERAREVLLS